MANAITDRTAAAVPEVLNPRRSAARHRARIAIKNPQPCGLGVWGKDPGDDLLSHAAAHYHRRVCVSLPSSEWDRVVPQSYCHQGEGGGSPALDDRVGRSIRDWVAVHEQRTRSQRGEVANWFGEWSDVSSSPRPLEVIWSSRTDH